MTKVMETVVRDANGNCINIGPWNYMEAENLDPDTGEVISTVQYNPLPVGATSKEEEITLNDDGSREVSSP